MTRTRRAGLVAVAILGYAAAFSAAAALVELRYRWEDPAVVAASSGMYAFGDLVASLTYAGVLSVAPTWLLLRALRDAGAFWTFASWTGLAWAALAPASVVLRLLGALAGPPPPAPAQASLVVLDGLAVLRLLVSPASFPGLAVAWRTCPPGAPRRRLGVAAVCEALGVAAAGLWVLWATLGARG